MPLQTVIPKTGKVEILLISKGNFLNFAVNVSTHYEYDIKLLNSVSALLKLPLQTVIPNTGKAKILLIWMGNF